jgi:hypothetical protein
MTTRLGREEIGEKDQDRGRNEEDQPSSKSGWCSESQHLQPLCRRQENLSRATSLPESEGFPAKY